MREEVHLCNCGALCGHGAVCLEPKTGLVWDDDMPRWLCERCVNSRPTFMEVTPDDGGCTCGGANGCLHNKVCKQTVNLGYYTESGRARVFCLYCGIVNVTKGGFEPMMEEK